MRSGDKPVAAELIKLTLEAAKLQTITGIYNRLRGGQDGRIRTKLAPYTDTGRLRSGEDDWWPEPTCLTGDAEVLTPQGWVRFDALDGDTVRCAQWDAEDDSITWCDAPIKRAEYSGDLVKAESWFQRMLYTPNHRVPYKHPTHPGFKECAAAELLSRTSFWKQPVSGWWKEGSAAITADEARMLAAIQADFRVTADHGLQAGFKKNRKQERIEALVQALGWEVTITTPPSGRDGYKSYYISPKWSRPLVLAWLQPGKLFDERVLTWPKAVMAAFIDELQYWDGHTRNESFVYYTVQESNATWVATLAHLCGRSTSTRVSENRNKGSYGEHSARPLYSVNVKPRTFIYGAPEHLSVEQYSGQVYCVTTRTSYFLARRRGQILVTGNTNLQNLPKKVSKLNPLYEVRNIVVPSPGTVFVEGDLKQAEAIATAAYAKDFAKVDRLMHADEHSLLAAKIFSIPVEEVKKDTHRQLGKMANHGLNYGVGWKTFMEGVNKDADITGLAIDAKMAKRTIAAWQAMNPKTVRWWQEVKQEVADRGYLVNCFGRKRVFLNTNTAGNEMLAYLPQSTIADLLNTALVAAFAKEASGLYKVVLQIHDAILIEAPKAKWMLAAKALKEIMLIPMTVHGKTLTVPVDISMSAKSWGGMKEVEV